ncbi:MAG: hypothetical protein M3131_01760 [Actinomycetota bacterium]|nr:hypothetical protein [Actinomycetota bacterium]
MNAKLAAAGSPWQFPTDRERPAARDGLPVWTESFVALDEGEVYGAYILKHQEFFVRGRSVEVGDLQLPVSLGHVDDKYSNVSVALLFDALRRTPRLYGLGFGSEQSEFAKLLTAARWQHLTVPFFFDVKSPDAFARNIRLPPDKGAMQTALRVLGQLRLAKAAFRLRRLRRLGRSKSSRQSLAAPYEVREAPRFDGSVDRLFEAHVKSYALIGDRRAGALNCLYPEDQPEYIRLVVTKDREIVGWSVVLDTRMHDHKYFGDLRVGSLADCLAAPGEAPTVVAAADEFLSRRGVDIVVSNQLHPAWCGALQAAGYEEGPSNFFLYFSDGLAKELGEGAAWDREAHINRGDGEGPDNL